MKVELNLTFRCQLACHGCDRLCGVVPPDPADDMTPAQVSTFIQETKTLGIHIDRVKVVGGEPLCHPQISEIVRVLIDEGIGSGVISSIKLDTNGIARIPADIPTHSGFRIGGRKPKKKIHLPYIWSPSDFGIEWRGPCSHTYRCGFSLDAKGWLPCSPAIMIDRLFYGEEHYRNSIPAHPWGVGQLCAHCIYAASAAFRAANVKPLTQFTPEMKMPTRSWAAALRRAGVAVEQIYEPGSFHERPSAISDPASSTSTAAGHNDSRHR